MYRPVQLADVLAAARGTPGLEGLRRLQHFLIDGAGAFKVVFTNHHINGLVEIAACDLAVCLVEDRTFDVLLLELGA